MSTVITVEGNLTDNPTPTRVPAAGSDGEQHADGTPHAGRQSKPNEQFRNDP